MYWQKKSFFYYHDFLSQPFNVVLIAMTGEQKNKQNEICKLYLFILNSWLHVFAAVLNNSCCQALQIFIALLLN